VSSAAVAPFLAPIWLALAFTAASACACALSRASDTADVDPPLNLNKLSESLISKLLRVFKVDRFDASEGLPGSDDVPTNSQAAKWQLAKTRKK